MQTITKTIYSAQELKEQFPEAFKSAYERYQQGEYRHGLNWGAEMLDSVKQAVSLSGYELKDYCLGDTSNRDNHLRLEERDCDSLSGGRAVAWLENNLLSKLRNKKGELDAGKLTGYCFDYDIIESLQNAVKGGDTIREAFLGLADVYARHADLEWEDQLSEERFIDTSEANNVMFFEDGREA